MGEAGDLLRGSIQDSDPAVAKLVELFGEKAAQTAELLEVERREAYEELVLFLDDAESGFLTAVLAGPMRSSKTFIGIAVGEHFEESGWDVMYAKSLIDTRDDAMRSNNGCQTSGCVRFEIEQGEDLIAPDLLVIDEVQFINDIEKLEQIISAREQAGKRTILCMLDQDFKREEWPQYTWALDHIQEAGGLLYKFCAICEECGARATRTQRELSENGVDYHPASVTDPAVLVEGQGFEKYGARCFECHRLAEDADL